MEQKTIIDEKTGIEFVLIPEGTFLYGPDKTPVTLPAYYMAKYPVTNAQYKRFKPDWPRNDNHPVVNVSWYDAKEYCEWAGLRLPSEKEWEKGARGTDGRTYPWGNEWDPKKCHNYENLADNQTTCPVDSYSEGVSPYGLYQMAGNVWEWCEDEYK